MPKRVLIGTVVSDKGDKTVTVRVERRVKHSLYGKIIRRSKKYHAHDADNVYRTGEQVRIEECKPISKHKSWTVIERLGAAKAVAIEIDEPDFTPEKGAQVEPKAETPKEETAEQPEAKVEKTEAKPEKTDKKPAKAPKGKGKAKAEDTADADAEA